MLKGTTEIYVLIQGYHATLPIGLVCWIEDLPAHDASLVLNTFAKIVPGIGPVKKCPQVFITPKRCLFSFWISIPVR